MNLRSVLTKEIAGRLITLELQQLRPEFSLENPRVPASHFVTGHNKRSGRSLVGLEHAFDGLNSDLRLIP